jgi:hypothetical protein
LHNRLIATLAAAVALSGCVAKPPAPEQAVDLQNEGIAKTCTPSKVDLASGAPATIAMTNDGWCGVFAAETDGQPFSLGLVKVRPAHGRVYIQPVNRQTRIEYTANAGYSGPDSFTVALRPRAANAPDSMLRVDVTVTPGEGQPVVAPAATSPRAPAAPARPPARRRATPRR